MVASAEGKNNSARALLSTGSGSVPPMAFQPSELNGKVGTVEMFTATPEAQLKFTKADNEMQADLTAADTGYEWGINGPYPNNKPFTVRQGQQAALTFTNKSRMWHPMHLHGHTFAVMKPDGSLGARKDTVIVTPNQSVKVAILADNRGIDFPTLLTSPWPLPDIANVGPTVATDNASATQSGRRRRGSSSGVGVVIGFSFSP